MHALDRGSVNCQQPQNKIERSHDRQIRIGVMIDFDCRIREEHPHDRVAKKQDADTHKKVEAFGLDQRCANALTDTVLFACTEVLGNIVGDGCHHCVIYKYGKLICFRGSSISGYGSSSEGVYDSLHCELSDTHDRHLEAHRKPGFQMKTDRVVQIMEIFTAQMQYREIFQSDDETEYC